MTNEEINANEKRENESFLRWIESPVFQLQPHSQRTIDLRLYMIAKNNEIANAQEENKALREALKELVSIVVIHQETTDNQFAWAEIECAQEALKGGTA